MASNFSGDLQLELITTVKKLVFGEQLQITIYKF